MPVQRPEAVLSIRGPTNEDKAEQQALESEFLRSSGRMCAAALLRGSCSRVCGVWIECGARGSGTTPLCGSARGATEWGTAWQEGRFRCRVSAKQAKTRIKSWLSRDKVILPEKKGNDSQDQKHLQSETWKHLRIHGLADQ